MDIPRVPLSFPPSYNFFLLLSKFYFILIQVKVQTYLFLVCLTSFQASRNVDLVLLGIFTMLLNVPIIFPTMPDAPLALSQHPPKSSWCLHHSPPHCSKKEIFKVPCNFLGISPLALNKFLASPSIFLVLPFIPQQAHFLPQNVFPSVPPLPQNKYLRHLASCQNLVVLLKRKNMQTQVSTLHSQQIIDFYIFL